MNEKEVMDLLEQYRKDMETRMCQYADGMRTLGPGREWAFGANEAAETELEKFGIILSAIKALK